MENNLLKTRFAVLIETTRGEIKIEQAADENTVGYHYKPIDKHDPYFNGPITVNPTGTVKRKQVEEALTRSWIEPTPEACEQVEDAACLVHALVAAHKMEDVAVQMTSDEFGGERFGPYTTGANALSAIVRLAEKADEDHVERTIGLLVNPEETDDDEDDDDFDVGGEG